MKKLLYLSILFLPLLACTNSTEKEAANKNVQATTFNEQQYLKNGAEITQATFKVLSSNLQHAISNGGIENAINFCSTNAQLLTDSLTNYYNVSVKRTSHKLRNPVNSPTPNEKAIIDEYMGGKSGPIVQQNEDGSVSYYSPIYTKGLCITCHGEVGKTIAESDYKRILEIYPKDEAIGFSVDELRGIWSLTFNQ